LPEKQAENDPGRAARVWVPELSERGYVELIRLMEKSIRPLTVMLTAFPFRVGHGSPSGSLFS
jgi:hypothetical protein